MPELLLGPVLRYVSETEATIWVETSAACTVDVSGTTTRTFEVGGHHYALVMLEGLEPDSVIPYQVRLDGAVRWPDPDDGFPPSTIRTLGGDRALQVLFGSCRSAAPHEEPYVLTADEHEEGLGVDALRANGLRMLAAPRETWPDMLVFLGDQVYADDASPSAVRRMERRAEQDATRHDDLPAGVVADFEEYTWLYRESWSPPVERWVMSVVPSVMIFDDHDVIDDWNTSEEWVADVRAEPWWQEHIIGAMTSYWIHQHLGNLSPQEIRAEGMLARLVEHDGDASSVLRTWAFESEGQTPIPGGYPFSFHRRLGDVHLVMVDTRNGRVLDGGVRKMIGDDEWDWIVDRCLEPCRHLIVGTSLPVFTPGGIHGLQQWSEVIAGGKWGRLGERLGERIRRGLDTEHWPGFDDSFRKFEQLVLDVAGQPEVRAPATMTVLGGDIHFSYGVVVEPRDGTTFASRVHQVVSSPIRNNLAAPERRAMRFAESDVGRRIGEFLRRISGRPKSRLRWGLDVDPIFDNTMALLRFEDDRVQLQMERAHRVDGREQLEIFDDRAL